MTPAHVFSRDTFLPETCNNISQYIQLYTLAVAQSIDLLLCSPETIPELEDDFLFPSPQLILCAHCLSFQV